MILAHHPEFADVTDPFGLPQIPDKWQAIERLASVLSPVRPTPLPQSGQGQDLLQRLYRHPVVGIVWEALVAVRKSIPSSAPCLIYFKSIILPLFVILFPIRHDRATTKESPN